MYHFINNRSLTINKMFHLADPFHVLEIGGGTGDPEPCTSTLFWCKTANVVYSINENPDMTQLIQKTCKKNNFHNLQAKTVSVADWAKSHYGPIDILYMDAWGPDVDGYQDKYVEAYELVKEKLGNKSVILVDDTPKLSARGRGIYLIEAARHDGWIIVRQDHQVLLARRANRH